MPSGNPCAHLKAGKAIIRFVQLLSSLTLETSHSQFAVYSNALYCRNYVQFNKNYDAPVGVLEAGAKHPFPLLHGQNQWRERHQSQRISDQNIISSEAGAELENVGLVCSAHGLLHISSLNWTWWTRHWQCSWAQDSPPHPHRSTSVGCFWSDSTEVCLLGNTSQIPLGAELSSAC